MYNVMIRPHKEYGDFLKKYGNVLQMQSCPDPVNDGEGRGYNMVGGKSSITTTKNGNVGWQNKFESQ